MIKILKTAGAIIGGTLICLGLVVSIFVNFIYGHVDTGLIQINVGLATALSIFVFLLGSAFLLKNVTGLFNSSPKALYIIRKILAYILLANLIGVTFIPPGPFLWLIFYNVAVIFCFYLLFTKRNGYFFGAFFFILGWAYALFPIFPGPTVWMTEFYTNPAVAISAGGDKLLLFQIIVVKIITALSGCFILLTALFKKTPATKS